MSDVAAVQDRLGLPGLPDEPALRQRLVRRLRDRPDKATLLEPADPDGPALGQDHRPASCARRSRNINGLSSSRTTQDTACRQSRRWSATTSLRPTKQRSAAQRPPAKIDTPTLTTCTQVSIDKKDIKDVVSTWLKAQGLVK
jgi:hypothetical protein